MQNWQATLESQFANSPTLLQMLEAINAWIDPSGDLSNFYSYIWDINTAQGFGLDIWGRILGVTRTFQVPQVTAPFFGFHEQGGPYVEPFDSAPFYSGSIGFENVTLSDADFRTLLLVKAMANISNAATPTYNAMLMMLFPGQGNCYVEDASTPGSGLLPMTMQITFSQSITDVQKAIITESGAFQPPTGVLLTIAVMSGAGDLTTQAYRITSAQSPFYASGPGWYFVDCSGGSVTFNLPTPAAGQSAECFIKRADKTWAPGATITVNPPAGYSMFDGASQTVLTEYGQSACFAADGISVIGAF